ncbi:alpha-amylase family glycosyl hydrolase [Paraglaciecola aquimarina]|uniref:Alpha-amylase family glycosyl hydrolase n=1 Tax=Paraglaciecola aquimarina TaxID=1235557 RepID=A0ABU3SX61_9ALTE|nr:alpha-amylase family glycosyl hydrolase [Paraglaciecola aquimarina]MDU0354581.1 alpha-amylase family glycosyl hydrolase [Paraglaciecola aquimarina]
MSGNSTGAFNSRIGIGSMCFIGWVLRYMSLAFLLFFTSSCAETNTQNKEELLLHVPSPDWRDQIVYFLMIDRFADGDPSNNDQGAAVYDPARESHYSGGDLKGIVEHLDYIQNLGATAVWTTPQVANQWWDPLVNYTGYHGYWARDFTKVDEHYGELLDYQTLSSELHKREMYLIQDIVVNHTGNFFQYSKQYDANNVQKNFALNSESLPSAAPTQFPFSQNDVNNPVHKAANIFNWTPDIADFSNPLQETRYQTAGLDDLNTQNPVVRQALKDSFGFWIKQAGVDAVRVDTAKYVEKDFYEDFLHSQDGLNQIAKMTGRQNFLSFGEIFQTSMPLQDDGELKLKQYVTNQQRQRLSSPIGFPLYKEMARVFAGGAPTAYMSYRLEAQMQHFSNPFLVSNFIDNHDVERFLASGNIAGFKQAYALMMTVPGIPTIYQGDEQGFLHSRRAMFAGGYLSDTDQFDQQAEMYQFIQSLANMRKAHKVFSRGSLQILQDNLAGAGVLAYRREYKGQSAYVIFNTAKQAVLLNGLQTEFDQHNPARILMSLNIEDDDLKVSDNGTITQVLPAQSLVVFLGQSQIKQELEKEKEKDELAITIDDLQASYQEQSQAFVSGKSDFSNSSLIRVIDGKVGQGKRFITDSDGNWRIDLPVADLGQHQHTLEIYSAEHNRASQRLAYSTKYSQIEQAGVVVDPKADDYGLNGKYIKPLDKSIGCQMDILQAQARAAGSVLELSIEMCEVSTLWSPTNGFDHLSLSIFFDLAKGEGKSQLPLIGGHFPNKKKWDLAHVAYGWGNYLYWASNASAQHEGDKPGIAPQIKVDAANNRITFTYFGDKFAVTDWADTTIYITTWDKSGEGNYRELAETPTQWRFGGATATSAKILDDALLQVEMVND